MRVRRVTTLDTIRQITENPKLLRFCEFIIAATGDKPFPIYKQLDLMKIANLAQHFWAIDFRDGVDNCPKFVFSGTHIDDHYGMNITGKCFEEIYVEDDFERTIRGNYYQVCLQKKISYTKRLAHYYNDRIDKYKTIEAMLFPCSSDGESIDYGVGYVEYKFGNSPSEKIFHLI
tara:strand:- start:20408 stop:20929 length:522 start_codon:yes stop_codon:yes gene_type:complete